MVVVGAKVKNGRRYPTYGCAAHRSKGSAICGNALTISEGKLSRAIFGALHELLASHDFQQRFADRFAGVSPPGSRPQPRSGPASQPR